MSRFQSKAALLAIALTGWAGSGSAQEAGTIVPEAEMTMFCQNAAAAHFDVQLDAITTNPPIRREGKLLVLGTVDDEGTDRDGGFDCRFEENGAYIDVIGAPGD